MYVTTHILMFKIIIILKIRKKEKEKENWKLRWMLGVVQLINEQTETHPMGNIFLDCRSLMAEFGVVSIKYVYHEVTYCADALAKDRCTDFDGK